MWCLLTKKHSGQRAGRRGLVKSEDIQEQCVDGIVEWPSMCNGLAGVFMPRRSQIIITFAEKPGVNLKPEPIDFLMNAVLFLGPHSGLVFGTSFWSWASLCIGSIMSEKAPGV